MSIFASAKINGFMDNRKRWELMDSLFIGGTPVSADEVFSIWEQNGIVPRYSSRHESARRKYELNFRQDIHFFKRIYAESDLEGPLFIEARDDTDSRKKTYKYSRAHWSIMPLINEKYAKSEWRSLDSSMGKLKKELSTSAADKLAFLVESRIDVLRGGKKLVDWSDNTMLRGYNILPSLYKSVKNRQPISVEFKMFNNPAIKCILHPYLLKEYLGRWYCLGYREDDMAIWPMAVDRMIAESLAPTMVPFIDFPVKGFSQEEYFDNIIGVTKEYNSNTAKDYLLTKEEYKVVLGIFSSKTWGIVNTRPLHRSQRVEMEFDRGKSYGEISITVIINIEMYLSILSIGRDISIVRPTFAKAEMLKMLKDIISNY